MRTSLLHRLANLQVERPGVPLLVTFVITVVALGLATRLTILTGFDTLIPESRPSVVELRRVAARTAGVSTLFVVLEAKGSGPPPTEALRKAADAIVPEVLAIGPPWVGSAESGVHEAMRFFEPRVGLFAEKSKLEKLRADVDARFEYEVAKATGALLDESDPPPAIDPEALKKDFGITDGDLERYPGGYYQSADGRAVVVTVRSKILGTDFAQGTQAIEKVRAAVSKVDPKRFDPSIEVGYAGDLQTSISEYTAINEDLTDVGLTGAALITAVVFLFYLRLRTLFVMVLTISVGVAWTFGFTAVTVGHLNMATGFLFPIVAGNGINTSILYMARYLEARRDGASLADGIRIAHGETWLPTLTAASAAAASYGSLCVTEFRGFRDFGLIGGVGMILCWLATYAALPAILTLVERRFPLRLTGRGLLARIRNATQGGIPFGQPVAAFVPRFPRLVTAAGLVLALAGSFALVVYVRGDPMEYDLRNLRTDASKRAAEIRLSQLGEKVTGHVGADGMAILVERLDQVSPLRAELARRRNAAPEGLKPFHDTHALQDFVPEDQAAKIPLLLAIKDKLVRAKKRGVVAEEDWKKLEPVLPPADLKPFGIEDLPEGVARAFTEADGTRGRIIYISPTEVGLVDDAHYLLRWADAYRRVDLPDGSTVLGSGRAVIYADMWSAILSDVPVAISTSFVATLAVVLVAFRGRRTSASVIAALLVGIAWMAGLLVVGHVKLNFLNFIALPITFGIGVDYAVNIVQRYVREGPGSAARAIRETGGAVILCSLTTMLGYVALVNSSNYAVRSLGVAAVIGELCCMAAGVIVLPAALTWMDARQRGKRSLVATESQLP